MTKQEWLDHFRKQEELGISGYKYCRENSISQGKFAYWKNKLKAAATPVLKAQTTKFVQVLAKQEKQQGANISISKVGEKITISFPHKDTKWLASLMRDLF